MLLICLSYLFVPSESWLAEADQNTREWAAAEAARLDAAMAYGPDNFDLFEEQMLKVCHLEVLRCSSQCNNMAVGFLFAQEQDQELSNADALLPASHSEFNRALSVRQYAQEFLKDDGT